MIKLQLQIDGFYCISGIGNFNGRIAPVEATSAEVAGALLQIFRDLQERGDVHRHITWRVRAAPEGLRILEGFRLTAESLRVVSEEDELVPGEFVFHFTHERAVEARS